jgi:hypothetical protein
MAQRPTEPEARGGWLEANATPAIPSEVHPAASRPKFRPRKCANRMTERRLRQPEIGSSSPATPDAPATATPRAKSRDERGINTESMSTSEVVDALGSDTLACRRKGRILRRSSPKRKLSGECRRLFCVVLAKPERALSWLEANMRAMEKCYTIVTGCLHLGARHLERSCR